MVYIYNHAYTYAYALNFRINNPETTVRGHRIIRWVFCLLCAFGATTFVYAGRSCDAAQPPAPKIIERALNLAQSTTIALDAQYALAGTRAVLIARAGQDLSKYNLRYSHMGWAYKTPEGPWRVVHKLNDCGTAVGHLYRQGLGDFFLDDLWRYEAVWAVPTLAVQQHLLAVLQDNASVRVLQHLPYSMVSYAWGYQYQQSNQWAIETLAAAMEPTSIYTRDQAQAWLKWKGYLPTILKIGPLARMGARISSANIALDDHPPAQRFSNKIETVTVDSVLAWMQHAQLISTPMVVQQN